MDKEDMEILPPLVHKKGGEQLPEIGSRRICKHSLVPGTVIILLNIKESSVNRWHRHDGTGRSDEGHVCRDADRDYPDYHSACHDRRSVCVTERAGEFLLIFLTGTTRWEAM